MARLIRDITVSQHMSPFSESMQAISPEFCRLYGEASVAERAPLPQAAGLAYAKALKLLIKDFAKLENPEEVAKIESANLATCVKEFLQDELLRASSELGVWLRNDQVHYKREYTEHGLAELKGIIHLVVRLIEQSEVARNSRRTYRVLKRRWFRHVRARATANQRPPMDTWARAQVRAEAESRSAPLRLPRI